MSVADLSVVGFQIVLPVILLIWLSLAPAKCLLLYVLQVITVALYLAGLRLVPIWLTLPWWIPWGYIGAGVAVIGQQIFCGTVRTEPRLPQSPNTWTAAGALALTACGLAVVVCQAIVGHALPKVAVDLAFPLGPGTYLVASGGSTATVNGHFATLDPQTERQRAYRGQSYAVDLVQLGGFGLRAPGWRPRDPALYTIFAAPVYAPCSGQVVSAADDMPDMSVPEMDRSRLEGNHVFIDCRGFGVLLAHFQKGSLRVVEGDLVRTGDPLGAVGNSGQSAEPHLHLHAQRIPVAGPLLAGDPLFITLGGRFLVRNDRLKI